MRKSVSLPCITAKYFTVCSVISQQF